MSKVGESIIRWLEQTVAFAEGTAKKGIYVARTPAGSDVKAIRAGWAWRSSERENAKEWRDCQKNR